MDKKEEGQNKRTLRAGEQRRVRRWTEKANTRTREWENRHERGVERRERENRGATIT